MEEFTISSIPLEENNEIKMNKKLKFHPEVVKGECPTCSEITMLVGLTHDFYRCMNCGADLEQHVNGKISYLPVMTSRTDGGTHYVKEWK